MLDEIMIEIQKRRPEISLTTCKQHARTIRKLYTTLWKEDNIFLPDRIHSCTTEKLLSIVPPNTSLDNNKRFAAAIGIFTKRPELSNIVSKANREYQNRINNHIPTDKEINNQLTVEDIIHIDKDLYNDYEKKRCPETIKRWLLWCLVSGKYIPPRRNLDWIAFKIRNIDQDKDNYLDHTTHTLIINRYKTQHIYGQDCIRIPDVLYDLFIEYDSVNPSDWLFCSNKKNRISETQFNKLVNSLSNATKGHGSNQYRKSYLQNKFGNIINLQETMRAMGSSKHMVNSYIKEL